MRVIILILIVGLLTGCDNDASLSDLQEYFEAVKKKETDTKPKEKINTSEQKIIIEPEVKDPFSNQLTGGNKSTSFSNQPLTSVPLEQLKVVGTVMLGEQIWAFIEMPNGQVIKAEKGMPIGVNNGEITEVMNNQVEVTERIFNRVGDILQRKVIISTARKNTTEN